MANSTDKAAPPSVEHQHQPTGDCAHAVASTIIQRHHDNRQRFDSADYEMAQRASAPCAACTCGKCAPTDVEREPEPGTAEARDQLRYLRLQRFDSADWALQAQRTQQCPQTDDPPATEPDNVAQMLMDRHGLKTCAYVGPAPVKNDADKA
ncbi:hypothetical protein V7S43_001349 [Phytophthora oleae]|uniref:Uncharacterized protein n=1 Tax=Phytophthora oleae TaxID=2107226 RepID=A0ABD3G3F8_9STRA